MAEVKTPREFTRLMKEFSTDGDMEAAHAAADDLMCEILTALGYGEGCNIFLKMDRWYA